jgi:arsenate reductase
VHPKSIETLHRHGINPGQPRSKSWNEFAEQPFELVITVCDQAAGESCPLFPDNPKKLQWGTPDPAKVTGSDANIDAAFDQVFFMLKNRIEEMLSTQDYWKARAKIETQMRRSDPRLASA